MRRAGAAGPDWRLASRGQLYGSGATAALVYAVIAC